MKDNKRAEKRRESRKHKRKLKELYWTQRGGVYLVKPGNSHKTVKAPFFRKGYFSKCLKPNKKLANRLVRRYKEGISNGNGYKKLYDIENEVYW